MRYCALAVDFDGTLATNETVDGQTTQALRTLRASGRHLILVTGRELPDILRLCPYMDLFSSVVAENGALIYSPVTRKSTALAEAPPDALMSELKARKVPFRVGQCLIATERPHDKAVLDAIETLGLELQLVFNRTAVMVLPSGINKAFGLRAALAELRLSAHNVVGIGDAENDHAFLSVCECSVAVANAVSSVQERADVVTKYVASRGVEEIIASLCADDMASVANRLTRHGLDIGRAHGIPVIVAAYTSAVLIAGSSGGGKSTLATTFIEQMKEKHFQFCLVDPEGDYGALEGAVCLGGAGQAPAVAEVLGVLADPSKDVVINLVGVPLSDRPGYLAALLPHINQLRIKDGHPHWLLLDEAHHMLPRSPSFNGGLTALEPAGLVLITVRPNHVDSAALAAVNACFFIGDDLTSTAAEFATSRQIALPPELPASVPRGQVVAWYPQTNETPFVFDAHVPAAEHRRHVRKYATGDLPVDRSFFFRGPQGKLNLRAQNLQSFLQLAFGVDDETWLFHLRRGDYAAWLTNSIKDAELGTLVAHVAQRSGSSAASSRAVIQELIEQRYTAAP